MTSARLCATALLLLSAPGCALFFGDSKGQSKLTAAFPWSRNESAPADEDSTPVLSVARLEASIVSRPASDSRIRRLVWEELDESGLMAPDLRQRLNSNGFRVGVAGSATPWALQSLAHDAAAATRTSDSTQSEMRVGSESLGPAFDLMQNGKSLLEIHSATGPDLVSLQDIPALAGIRDRSSMKCVFEVVAREITNDGVLLSVLPQIHTGAATTRLSISGMSEQMPVRQNIVPLYEQQFSIRLHPGEVAVIGRQESDSELTVGRLFFHPHADGTAEERLLMLRFVGVEKLRGQSDPTFRLNASGR